jgi:transaldolase
VKFFLDSARIDEIRYAYEHWGIDGITTNPRHVYTSGKSLHAVMQELAEEFRDVELPISIEIDPRLDKADTMIAAARPVAAMSKNFVIKIGCTEQGLVAARKLESEGIRTNVTLAFSPSQALQAGRIGATFVSPFVGWREASGDEGRQLVADIVRIYQNYSFETEIIVAAVRNGRQIADAAIMGAHIVTAGFDVYKDSFYHPFTDYGTEVFTDAWLKTDTTMPDA